MRRARRKAKNKKKLNRIQLAAIAMLEKRKKQRVPSSDIFVTITGEELLMKGYVRLIGKPIILDRLYRVRLVDNLPLNGELLPVIVPPELKESSKLIKALIKQEKERIRQTYLTTRKDRSVQDAR